MHGSMDLLLDLLLELLLELLLLLLMLLLLHVTTKFWGGALEGSRLYFGGSRSRFWRVWKRFF